MICGPPLFVWGGSPLIGVDGDMTCVGLNRFVFSPDRSMISSAIPPVRFKSGCLPLGEGSFGFGFATSSIKGVWFGFSLRLVSMLHLLMLSSSFSFVAICKLL